MSVGKKRVDTGLIPFRVESGRLLAPSTIAGEITGFEETKEDTLRSVRGPTPYVPAYSGANPIPIPTYGNCHGIFHAMLMGGKREVLLAHTANRVRLYQGWTRAWIDLIGPSGSSAQVETELIDDTAPRWPTQFEATPNGIVIIPQGHDRAYFYDGEVCTELGYHVAPAAPFGYGPEQSDSVLAALFGNDEGFSYSGTEMHPDFGSGRLGTVGTESNEDGGTDYVLRPGAYAWAYRWIDRWGNLSPLSPRSNTVSWRKQSTDSAGVPTFAESRLKFVQVTSIERGRTGTIGRPVCRTKDLVNSGTTKLFVLPNSTGGALSGSFATIPDNQTVLLPDNTPDMWLVAEAMDTDPMPRVKLARLAFERMWYISADDPSQIMPSLPGLWGTPEKNGARRPDPSGGDLTGAWAVHGGLLVFTNSSTFLITPSDLGTGFVTRTLDPSKGCVAPDSCANLPDGSAVWLGREGFYRFDGQAIALISEQERHTIQRIGAGRALQATGRVDVHTREYRCWVPIDGSIENNRCMIFDGNGWRQRDASEQYRAVCIERNHHARMLATGTVGAATGVWIVDHESFYPVPDRVYAIETPWLRWEDSQRRKTATTVYLFLRETDDGSITITSYRDWRKTTVVDTQTATRLRSPEDVPATWGTTIWDQTMAPNQWVRRRAFWYKADLFIPSCEVYRLRITANTTPIEFIGLALDEIPRDDKARVPR